MKLTKAQEKRFDELWNRKVWDSYTVDKDEIKQHLADELATQKKEIVEKLEKSKGIGDDFATRTANNATDQAIETIKHE